MPTPMHVSEPSYPSTYIRVPEGSGLELPDSGEITFRFRVRRETDDKREGACTYDIDLLSVLGVKGDKSDDGESDDAGERITKAFRGKTKD